MIKFLDLVGQYKKIKTEIDEAIHSVIADASFIGGNHVSEFETRFARYVGASNCVGVNSGTDALEISLAALDIPKGSEVIVPANSFIASSEAVTREGLRVVFADVNTKDFLLDIDDVIRKITPNTKAIIAVHLYGQPCDMNPILRVAREHGLYVIEDCAQAHGAEYEGEKVGTLGDVGCFSFYPGKNLGAYGDAGAITTNNQELAIKARKIANHGRVAKYDHEFEGRNSRLDALQAAVLNVKLNHIEDWTRRRIAIADLYLSKLSDVNKIELPFRSSNVTQVYHLFVIKTEYRDDLKAYLLQNGIESGIHYPIALPKLEAYRYMECSTCPVACSIDSTLLSLPIGDHMTIGDADKVVNAVKAFFKEKQ
ncbi:DegT/DnrJ/EryC1/StrS family aminotransferase [Aliidiomarina maris]|uniref:Erythromycin biosynthesis sensory transduction protein eryC1 n=1 Tax=Aliidiomarina maris TaxID=531312 RepID=A0A327WS00_9GAMM|nr:DegT/DnrJ/EryC1/StrS family aminotransferase [Aliidiomarina maris]RAJ93626.1 dTDP-4-amino-4,6-dideoxygalactose transaminase [Aliidiomarina maris]RUO19077.1 erythromycin biosynthesis sensory transduction protein eryC1 [Aliidiomarina maris]